MQVVEEVNVKPGSSKYIRHRIQPPGKLYVPYIRNRLDLSTLDMGEAAIRAIEYLFYKEDPREEEKAFDDACEALSPLICNANMRDLLRTVLKRRYGDQLSEMIAVRTNKAKPKRRCAGEIGEKNMMCLTVLCACASTENIISAFKMPRGQYYENVARVVRFNINNAKANPAPRKTALKRPRTFGAETKATDDAPRSKRKRTDEEENEQHNEDGAHVDAH